MEKGDESRLIVICFLYSFDYTLYIVFTSNAAFFPKLLMTAKRSKCSITLPMITLLVFRRLSWPSDGV